MILPLCLNISFGEAQTDLPSGALKKFVHGVSVYTVAFSPDGRLLASGGNNNKVIIWDIENNKEHWAIRGHSKSVMSVVFSPNGELLASASHDGYVRLWQVTSKNRLHAFLHGGWVRSVAFSPDGNSLVSCGGGQKGSITLWDVHQKARISDLPGHNSIVDSIVFSPNGKFLASTSRDRTVKLWDITSQQQRRSLTKHKSVVYAVAFSPDSNFIATSSEDYTIKLWDTSSGENVADFKVQGDGRVRSLALAFSPDGAYLALACSDNTIRLWNVDDRKETTKIRGHTGVVSTVSFSPDGRTLASGSRDRTILLWDLAKFNIVRPQSTPFTKLNPDTKPDNKPEPLVVDNIPPEIVVISPTGSVVPENIEELTVRGKVTDSNSIGIVKVNNKEVEVMPEGRFDAFVKLAAGKNEIRITASDIHGNMGTKRFTVDRPIPIDTTPPIIVLDESSRHERQSKNVEFTVTGTVIDENGVEDVKVNGENVPISVEGIFTTSVQLVKGENLIRVAATDTQGNMDTKVSIINIRNPGPKIEILEPYESVSRGLKPRIIDDAFTTVSGEVEDDDGVSNVTVNGKNVTVSEKRFSTRVSLVEGDNSIRITATDSLGAESMRTILIHRPESYRTGKDYALLFGVEDYDNWPNLRHPISDAKKIQGDLEDIYGFQTELITNPTKEEIFKSIRKYAEMLYNDDDQLLIFFAGHGHFDEIFREGYLVVQDTRLPVNDDGLLSFVSHTRIREIIDRMNCKHVLLVMDTCYSGTFGREIAMRGSAEDLSEQRMTNDDVKRILEYTTRWYLTSGQKEQVPDISKFVAVFLDALRKKGGGDKILTIKELLNAMKHLDNPKPHASEFGSNEPGSDFLFFAK